MPKTFSMMGNARVMISAMPMPSTGSTARNTSDSRELWRKAMTRAKMSVQGERKAMRVIIMKACCTFVTSVVMRVTRPAVEKWSMFWKENSCTWWNMSWRRLLAKPAEAREANTPPRMPNVRDSSAKMTSRSPSERMTSMFPASIP